MNNLASLPPAYCPGALQSPSPPYSPTSPSYSPASPSYSPTSPSDSSTSPSYSPTSPTSPSYRSLSSFAYCSGFASAICKPNTISSRFNSASSSSCNTPASSAGTSLPNSLTYPGKYSFSPSKLGEIENRKPSNGLK